MKKYFNHFIAVAIVAVIATGCASAPSRFYTLNSTVTAGVTPAANYAVIVGPVSVPTEVDRPQFTVQVAPNRVAIDEFNRWAEPLNDNIARAVAGDLAALLGTPRVAVGSLASFNPDYRVTLAVQQFESVPGKYAKIKVVWIIRKTTGGDTTTGITEANEPVKDANYDALAAAHSRALAKVSTDVAAAIRSEAETKP
jgi:uncharacterized lipoprotein YmbA